MDEGCDNEIILIMKMSMAEQSRVEQGSLGGYDFGNWGLDARCLATATDGTTAERASEHGEKLHAETPGAGSTMGKCRPQRRTNAWQRCRARCWGLRRKRGGV